MMEQSTSSIYSEICKEHGIYVLLLYRTHSERLFNKAKRPFIGEKSLLDIKTEQLLESFPEENIIVAGDDYALSDNYDHCTQYIKREMEYTIGNEIPFSDVLMHTFNMIALQCSTAVQQNLKHLIITYPTCPTFDDSCYKKAIMHYHKHVINGPHDSIMSGESKPGFFWMNGKPINYEANSNHKYTQDIDPVFEADNAIWGGEYRTLFNKKYLIGDNPYFFENDRLHACDVDTVADFEHAKLIYRALNNGY